MEPFLKLLIRNIWNHSNQSKDSPFETRVDLFRPSRTWFWVVVAVFFEVLKDPLNCGTRYIQEGLRSGVDIGHFSMHSQLARASARHTPSR